MTPVPDPDISRDGFDSSMVQPGFPVNFICDRSDDPLRDESMNEGGKIAANSRITRITELAPFERGRIRQHIFIKNSESRTVKAVIARQ